MINIFKQLLNPHILGKMGFSIDDEKSRELDSKLEELAETFIDFQRIVERIYFIIKNNMSEHFAWVESQQEVLVNKLESMSPIFEEFTKLLFSVIPLDKIEVALRNLQVAPELEDERQKLISLCEEFRKYIERGTNNHTLLEMSQETLFTSSMKREAPLTTDLFTAATELLPYTRDRYKPLILLTGEKRNRFKDKVKELSQKYTKDADKVRILAAALELGYISDIPSDQKRVYDEFEIPLGSDRCLKANKDTTRNPDKDQWWKVKVRKTRIDCEDDKEEYTPLPIYNNIRSELKQAVEGE